MINLMGHTDVQTLLAKMFFRHNKANSLQNHAKSRHDLRQILSNMADTPATRDTATRDTATRDTVTRNPRPATRD